MATAIRLGSSDQFLARLDKTKGGPKLGFAVLGFGDRQFPRFCQFAKDAEIALLAHGWLRLLELDTIDRQSVQEFPRWGNAVGKAMSLELDATAAATAAVTAAVPSQIQKDIDAGTCQPADAQATNCQTVAIATLTLTVGAEVGAAYAADPEKLAIYVAAMARAGDQLATLVNTQIVANGANHVTVLNLPDASKTPYALAQSGKAQDGLARWESDSTSVWRPVWLVNRKFC